MDTSHRYPLRIVALLGNYDVYYVYYSRTFRYDIYDMNQEEIIAFIQEHSNDASPEAIKDALVSSGVSEEDIEKAWENSGSGANKNEAAVGTKASVIDAAWDASLLPNASAPEQSSAPVAISVVAPSTAPKTPTPKGTKASLQHHSAKFPAVAIILASFIIGGGAFAYWSFIEPALTPAEVFGNMSTALGSITSGTYSGTIEVSFELAKKEQSPGLPTAVYTLVEPLLLVQNTEHVPQGEKSAIDQTMRATFSVSGGFDGSDSTKKKGSFEGKLSGSAMGQEFEIGMEARMTGDANFVKFNNISPIAPRYKPLEKEWIKFDPASVGAFEGAALNGMSTTTTAEEKFKNISPQAKEKINALFKNAHLFTLMGHGKEAIRAGLTAYHYGLDVDKEGLKQFLNGLLAIVYGEGIPKETFGFISPSQKDASDSIQAAINAVQETSGDIWIGTQDFLPYKSDFVLTIQEPSGHVFHLKMHIDFDNWNKPLAVTAPTKFIPAEDVLSSLGFGGGNGEATSTQNYYDNLANECSTKESESCCRASVETMKAGNYTLTIQEGCPANYQSNKMRCSDSYAWCQPMSALPETTNLSP